jgi:Family of unknown function (DUF6338)
VPNLSENLDSIAIIFMFVIPGFVSFQSLKIICPPISRNQKDFYFAFVTLSGLNFAICGLLVPLIANSDINIYFRVILWTLYIFIVPTVTGVVIGGFIQNNLLQRALKSKFLKWTKIRPSSFGVSAWDSLFSDIDSRYAIVTLIDGREFKVALAGNAHMSADASERDIYFDKVFEGNEKKPWKEVPRSLYVAKDQIQTIEFFNP